MGILQVTNKGDLSKYALRALTLTCPYTNEIKVWCSEVSVVLSSYILHQFIIN